MQKTEQITLQRQEKDKFFKHSPYAPLSPEQQAKFDGLRYFDPNPALAFELKAEPFADQKHVQMQTSTGEVRTYLRWGQVKFPVDGQEATLTLYFQPGQEDFFLPFTDSTSGDETYGAGRYLEVKRLPDGKVRLDFNDAYNPYCAYGPNWSCPIPPAENRLKVPIRAGEKTPGEAWSAYHEE
ncbi:MAG TPA: DUF1684 domain-containing protein [Aggregatilineales bacterium]|nr:DUF1684 domain-containing protein [Aggregatilineales bacterium]